MRTTIAALVLVAASVPAGGAGQGGRTGTRRGDEG